MPPQPGEIYWAYLDDAHRRPVVVVSREELNRGHYVVAVPVTSSKLKIRWDLPNCVPLQAGQYGLERDCVAQAEAVESLHQSYLDFKTRPIGTLDRETMRVLVCAVGYAISADCEPV